MSNQIQENIQDQNAAKLREIPSDVKYPYTEHSIENGDHSQRMLIQHHTPSAPNERINVNGILYERVQYPSKRTPLLNTAQVHHPESRPMSDFQRCVIAIVCISVISSIIISVFWMMNLTS